jgi:CRP-like cAMP-binding protein
MELAKELAVETFPAGSYVVKQGDPGESMYVIRAGKAVAELTGIGKVRDYEAGGFFGEMALVTSEPRKASVRAVGELSVYVLTRATFERLVGKLAQNMEGLRRRFHVAAYTFGRRDYSKLFRHYDKNNSGYLEEPEFRAAVRKDGRIDLNTADKEIRTLYCLLDVDRDGLVSEEDFVTFLGVVNPVEYELRIEDLRQESLKLKGEAARVMMETDANAGRRAKELLKKQVCTPGMPCECRDRRAAIKCGSTGSF